MIRIEQWISDSRRQQFSFLFLSAIVLLYSVVNLIVHEKFISILFILVALVLFILSVMNRKAAVVHEKMIEHILLIRKAHDDKKSSQSSLVGLNKKQRQLWQYIVTDYSVDELQHIFSITESALSKDIGELVKKMNDEKKITLETQRRRVDGKIQ